MFYFGWFGHLHFSDTDGPGCIVCSMNLYNSCGAPSAKRENEKEKNPKILIIKFAQRQFCFFGLFSCSLSVISRLKTILVFDAHQIYYHLPM